MMVGVYHYDVLSDVRGKPPSLGVSVCGGDIHRENKGSKGILSWEWSSTEPGVMWGLFSVQYMWSYMFWSQDEPQLIVFLQTFMQFSIQDSGSSDIL